MISKSFFNFLSVIFLAGYVSAEIYSHGQKIELSQLHHYADACNNEGGSVSQCLTADQQWMNLEFVLDRPLQDNHTLSDLNQSQLQVKHLHPLKESILLNYNEARTNQCCLLVLSYLIDNMHEICKVDPSQIAQLTVHVHRRSSGITQIHRLLIPMIKDFYKSKKSNFTLEKEVLSNNPDDYRLKLKINNDIEIIFRNGYDSSTYKDYKDSHVILSLGIVMGLNPSWPSSTVLLPETFIPTNEEKGEIYQNLTYCAKNHLKDHIEKIVNDKARQHQVIEVINNNTVYQSTNPSKNCSDLIFLTQKDFHFPTLLQIKTHWSPKISDRPLTIMDIR